MFGKPEWFVDKTFGWGLVPVTWQGWAYTFAWCGVIATPFVVLLTQHKPSSAAIWMVAGIVALVWDVWQIKKRRQADLAKSREPDLYINDDGASLETRSFDMKLKR